MKFSWLIWLFQDLFFNFRLTGFGATLSSSKMCQPNACCSLVEHLPTVSAHEYVMSEDQKPWCQWRYFLTGPYALYPCLTHFQRKQPMKTTQQMTGGSLWTSATRLERQPMGKLETGIFLWIIRVNLHLSSTVVQIAPYLRTVHLYKT